MLQGDVFFIKQTNLSGRGGNIVSNTSNEKTSYIGKTPTRVDAYDKATGKGLFASD